MTGKDQSRRTSEGEALRYKGNSRFLTPFTKRQVNGFGMTIKYENRRTSEGEALRYKGKVMGQFEF